MSQKTIGQWLWLHKWSSLICTLFMLLLCITGLPLTFHDEIDALTDDPIIANAKADGMASAQAGQSLDDIVAMALSNNDGHYPLFIGFSQDTAEITVTTGTAPDAPGAEMQLFSFNRTSGAAMGEIKEEGFMHIMLELHIELLAGQWGMWFLGAMAVLFVIALISGVVLYAPFMARLRFGTVRVSRSKRVKWLDYHNLLGIVALGWCLVLGLTGIINAYADPLTDNWRASVVADMQAQNPEIAGENALALADYANLDTAMAAAKSAIPGLSPQFIGFPGGSWSTPHHYAIFFQGDSPLTGHILTPVFVNARTGAVDEVRNMPLINQALMISKPLHFGDYGGLPLKIIWALLDLATIWILVTGLLLWLKKGRKADSAETSPA